MYIRAKYPLAIVEHLLHVFSPNLGGGYDIGCKFGTTLDHSPLGPLARANSHKCLVGAFHGHAHNRLCQLSNLATYVKGVGLEDLEGCECWFSHSIELAPAVRYASIFHRLQALATYCKHADVFDAYANLSIFLLNNYIQALNILKGETALAKAMKDQGITDPKTFELWLEEERAYLKGLAKEPVMETMEMEYYLKLVKLYATE